MNRYFLILLHSVLLIGTLLPLPFPPSAHTSPQPTLSSSSQLLAFGSGIPESRGGGGTR